ncbi:hypothetical protein CASFOL_031606 [Castilleja foliolosa]|uniref:Uncharacterized protein n=1 Tax=Castilleja foliolosa TaxID=1961234 RepID=A0ABD3C571_9LAMI
MAVCISAAQHSPLSLPLSSELITRRRDGFNPLSWSSSFPNIKISANNLLARTARKKEDNKWKSPWDDGDLDDNEKKKKRFEALKEAPLDPVEEKLHQQRLVGEADYKSTAELFGKMGDEKTLDNFIPKSEGDFTEYAELVAHKLRSYELSLYLIAEGCDEIGFFKRLRC